MPAKGLTEANKDFCRLIVELNNGSEAYRRAFSTTLTGTMLTQKVARLKKKPEIAAEIKRLRERVEEASEVRAVDLVRKLERAYDVAEQIASPGGMVSAVMGVARITGLDKQVVEHRTQAINLVINRPSGA